MKQKTSAYYDQLTNRKVDSMRLALAITTSMFKQKQKLARVTNPDARQAKELERLTLMESILTKAK